MKEKLDSDASVPNKDSRKKWNNTKTFKEILCMGGHWLSTI